MSSTAATNDMRMSPPLVVTDHDLNQPDIYDQNDCDACSYIFWGHNCNDLASTIKLVTTTTEANDITESGKEGFLLRWCEDNGEGFTECHQEAFHPDVDTKRKTVITKNNEGKMMQKVDSTEDDKYFSSTVTTKYRHELTGVVRLEVVREMHTEEGTTYNKFEYSPDGRLLVHVNVDRCPKGSVTQKSTTFYDSHTAKQPWDTPECTKCSSTSNDEGGGSEWMSTTYSLKTHSVVEVHIRRTCNSNAYYLDGNTERKGVLPCQEDETEGDRRAMYRHCSDDEWDEDVCEYEMMHFCNEATGCNDTMTETWRGIGDRVRAESTHSFFPTGDARQTTTRLYDTEGNHVRTTVLSYEYDSNNAHTLTSTSTLVINLSDNSSLETVEHHQAKRKLSYEFDGRELKRVRVDGDSE